MTRTRRSTRLTYANARGVLALVGVAILFVIVAVMLVRGVDQVEVVGALLFIPVLLAFLVAGVPGGGVAGFTAAAVYLAMRIPAMDAVGTAHFRGLILTRTAAYVAFGVIGGFATSELRSSLHKLDRYDEIDDATGLKNARSFLLDADLEMGRARRYGTLFSVALVEIPRPAFAVLGRRRQAQALRELGESLRELIRTVDHPVHSVEGDRHLFAVILPETPPGGAREFGVRLTTWLQQFGDERSIVIDDPVIRVASFPEDEAEIVEMCGRFTEVAAAEHAVVDPRSDRGG